MLDFGRLCKSPPAAKSSIISEAVWMLETTRAKKRVIVLGWTGGFHRNGLGVMATCLVSHVSFCQTKQSSNG
jgi:hypothetical protein